MFDLATLPKGMITKGAIKKRSSIEPSGAWLVDANQARIAQMSAPARALGRSLVLAIANCFIILIFLLRQKYQKTGLCQETSAKQSSRLDAAGKFDSRAGYLISITSFSFALLMSSIFLISSSVSR